MLQIFKRKQMRIVTLGFENFEIRTISMAEFLRKTKFYGFGCKFFLLVDQKNPNNFILLIAEGDFLIHRYLIDWAEKNLPIICDLSGGGLFTKVFVNSRSDELKSIKFHGSSHDYGVVEEEYITPKMKALIAQAFRRAMHVERISQELPIEWYDA